VMAAFDTFEQQRGTAFVDHATMDLGEFEVRINLGFDGDDFVFSGKSIEKCAKARMHSKRNEPSTDYTDCFCVICGWPLWFLNCAWSRTCLCRSGLSQTFLDLVVSDLCGFGYVRLVRLAKRLDQIQRLDVADMAQRFEQTRGNARRVV